MVTVVEFESEACEIELHSNETPQRIFLYLVKQLKVRVVKNLALSVFKANF